jgi:hypothetical protein
MRDFFRNLNERRKAWRAANKYAHDLTMAVLAGILIGALWLGIGLRAFAATLTLDLPMCSSFAWDAGASKLTCVTGTTPPPPPPVTPPPPPPVTPSNPYAACPAGTLIGGDVWGLSNIQTSDAGAWGDGQVLVYRIVPVAAMSSPRNSTWAAYSGGGGARDYSVTTQACDFSGTTAIGSSYAPNVKVIGSSSGPQFYYRAGTNIGGQVTMEVGKVYYLNLRNPPGSCPSGNCVMRGSVPK